MPVLDSVAHILEESGPLHYRAITEELLTRGPWSTTGTAYVRASAVQQLRGSLGVEEHRMLTASDLSKGAIAEAERPGATHIALMNSGQLVDLLIRYEVGAARTENMVAEIIENGLASVAEGEDGDTGG